MGTVVAIIMAVLTIATGIVVWITTDDAEIAITATRLLASVCVLLMCLVFLIWGF